MLCYRASFSVINKIAISVGHEKLEELFEEIITSPESSDAQKLVGLAVLLEQKSELPKSMIETLDHEAGNNSLVHRLIRELIIRHAYLNKIDVKDRQWIENKLGLTMEYQRAIQNNKHIQKSRANIKPATSTE